MTTESREELIESMKCQFRQFSEQMAELQMQMRRSIAKLLLAGNFSVIANKELKDHQVQVSEHVYEVFCDESHTRLRATIHGE